MGRLVSLPVDHLVGILAQDLLGGESGPPPPYWPYPPPPPPRCLPLPSVLLVPDLRSQRGVPVPMGPSGSSVSARARNVNLPSGNEYAKHSALLFLTPSMVSYMDLMVFGHSPTEPPGKIAGR